MFPTHGRSNAVRTEPVSAVFTRELLASTVNASTFILNGPTGSPVAGSVISSGAVATFVPAQPLEPGKSFSAVLSSAITDTDGRSLTNAGAWSFGTATSAAWHVYKTGAQGGLGTSPTKIRWDSVEYDFAGAFDDANDLIAIVDSGLYVVGVSLTFGSVPDGVGIQIELFKNGSPLKRFQTQPSAGVHNLCFGGSIEVQLQSGDTLETSTGSSRRKESRSRAPVSTRSSGSSTSPSRTASPFSSTDKVRTKSWDMEPSRRSRAHSGLRAVASGRHATRSRRRPISETRRAVSRANTHSAPSSANRCFE